MGSVEFFIVLAVAALNFAIVSRGIGADQFVLNPQFSQCFLKKGLSLCCGGVETVREFRAVVRLDALNGKGELSDKMADK